jgi:hypothetical protein
MYTDVIYEAGVCQTGDADRVARLSRDVCCGTTGG